ncbi:hypothetical protein N2152v2_005064 [Parachlorella kessleri]
MVGVLINLSPDRPSQSDWNAEAHTPSPGRSPQKATDMLDSPEPASVATPRQGSADLSRPPGPHSAKSLEVHGPPTTPAPTKVCREVETQAATARLKLLAAKLASGGQQSRARGQPAAAELASMRQAGSKARDVLQAASSTLSAACIADQQRQQTGATAVPRMAPTPGSAAAATTAASAAATEAAVAAALEAGAAQQALEKAETELAAVKRERDQLSTHLAPARAAEARVRKELRAVQRDMQRMVAAASEGSLAIWQGCCDGGEEGQTHVAVLLAWEVQRLEEEKQALLGQVREMQERTAAEHALGRSPQQLRGQYLERVRVERDQLRQECHAALRQRFRLQQCIRFLAAKAHLPVAVRLSATGRPRQDPLAAVLPAALAECRTPACPTSPPQPTSPSWESRGKSRTHQGGLSRAEQDWDRLFTGVTGKRGGLCAGHEGA